ncbi:MAG: hypothetical protein GPJ54_18570 [Candidatus Heimdallarchaeota archaeon]|nr:hypothetical protein [Candidatus Heimdallarchaeota archaeon]
MTEEEDIESRKDETTIELKENLKNYIDGLDENQQSVLAAYIDGQQS